MIISFQELFIVSKYHKFWLSCEWFSVTCCLVRYFATISGWKRCVIWLKFCPKDHIHYFFRWFPINMLGNSININNLCCNPLVLKKKLVKPPKNCSFGTNLHKKRVIMGHSHNEKQFFWQKWQKQIISFQKHFILSKYYMFWLSYESFSILSAEVFCQSVISSNSCAVKLWRFIN